MSESGESFNPFEEAVEFVKGLDSKYANSMNDVLKEIGPEIKDIQPNEFLSKGVPALFEYANKAHKSKVNPSVFDAK